MLVRDGRVMEVGEVPGGDEVVDCTGLWLLPGAIDAHVHSRDPGFPAKEDWTSLTTAAAAGGVTTVVDMPNTVPAVDDAQTLEAKAALAASKALVDFGLWGLLRTGSTADMLAGLLDAGAVGLKAYLGYAYRRSTRSVTYSADQSDADLEPPPGYEDIGRLAPRGALVAVHGEDPEVLQASARPLRTYADVLQARPVEAEARALRRLADLPLRLHAVHVSSAEGLAAVRHGHDVSVETCPQYLWATAEDYARVGNALRMNPPVRTAADRAVLRAGVADGRIDTIGTDHAPHTDAEKFEVDLTHCHPGSPGVQTLLLSTLQLGRDLRVMERALACVTSSVAARLRLPGKGVVEPGADADLVLVDPNGETIISAASMRSKQKHGVLEGMRAGFAVRAVYARGELVVRDGEISAEPGRGRLVRPR